METKPVTQDLIKILFNGFEIEEVDPNKIMANIIESIPDLRYYSIEALTQFYSGMLTLMGKYCSFKREQMKGSQKTKMTRFANSIQNKIKYLSKDKEKLLMQIYEIVMKDYGCGEMRKR